MIHSRSKTSIIPLLASGLLLAAGTARAAVTWSGVQNIPIPTSFNGVYLNLAILNGDPSEPSNVPGDADGEFDFGFAVGYNQPTDWDVNFFFGGIGIAYSDTFSPFVDGTGGDPNDISGRSQILNVAAGTDIQSEAASRALGVNSFGGSGTPNGGNGESHFNTPDLDGSTYSAFTPGQEGYIAFTIDTGSGTQYGWMRVTLDSDGPNNGDVGVIHDWAYSSDAGFLVGQIPEPNSLVLLLLGSLGLMRRRR